MASKFLALGMGFLLANNGFTQGTHSNQMAENVDTERRAVCILNSEAGQTAKGVVQFVQSSYLSKTHVEGKFEGLTPNHKHGFHIHQYGNLTQGCVTAGPHYNPFKTSHGSLTSAVRHVGDMGNLESDAEGKATIEFADTQMTLSGVNSIIGRACVLHRDEDDLGLGSNEASKENGNSGPRIACGIIGLSKE